VDEKLIPLTESLKDTVARAIPYWEGTILKALSSSNQILVAAHGNSLRGIIKHLKNISDNDISEFNLPTATPYVFEFDDKFNYVRDYFLGNADEIAKQMAAVANQGKKQ
jgi:2,3-bisphosphoglycerate-dependent phosphoglycerate mutase